MYADVEYMCPVCIPMVTKSQEKTRQMEHAEQITGRLGYARMLLESIEDRGEDEWHHAAYISLMARLQEALELMEQLRFFLHLTIINFET